MSPVATRGSPTGSDTRVSSTARAGNRRRAGTHATARPRGSLPTLARAVMPALNTATESHA